MTTVSPIATGVLIALKQQLPPRYKPALKNFFIKGVVTFNTMTVSFDKIKKGRKLAPFVSPMIKGKPQKSKGGILTTVQPAYLKPTDVVSSERLVKRSPGEQLNGELSPAQRLNAIRGDILVEQEESISRSEEWMCCELLKTGAVTIKGEDFEEVHIDYQRSSTNNVTLAGADKWSQQNTEQSRKPLDDIEDWAERINIVADVVVMGKKAWRSFRSFKAIRDLLDSRRGSESRAELGILNNESFKYVGTIGELDFFVYVGAYEKDDDTVENYIDEDGVVVTGRGLDLFLAYGGIQDVKANSSGIVETSRYAKNWYTDDPSVEWLQTQSAPVPILLDADEICYARIGS